MQTSNGFPNRDQALLNPDAEAILGLVTHILSLLALFHH